MNSYIINSPIIDTIKSSSYYLATSITTSSYHVVLFPIIILPALCVLV